MPGLAGIVHNNESAKSENIERMLIQMKHADYYRLESTAAENTGIGTAVLDHTENGVFENDKSIVCFYGEVFEVRSFEPLSAFPLQNPVEVHRYILKYGFNVIEEFNGAFILAYYEKDKKRLRIANDRMAIHRLFYYVDNQLLAFASEAKALYCVDGFIPQPHYAGITELLTSRFTYGGRTFWKGVRLLPHGTILCFEGGRITLEKYWEIQRSNRKKVKSNSAYADELYQIMERAVALRTPESDVSMGLSGGCDSRTILALLPKHGRKVHSFTYGTANCGDVVCAEELADVFQTDQKYVAFTGRDMETYSKQVVWLTDGTAEPDLFFHTIMAKLKREKAYYELSSVPGDAVSGKMNAMTVLLLLGERKILSRRARSRLCQTLYQRNLMGKPSIKDANIFNPEFYAKVRNYIESDVRNSFNAECGGEYLTDILLQTLLFEGTVGHTLPIMGGIPSSTHTVRFPFLDYNVLDFFCRIPSRLWVGQKTYLDMIAQHLKKAAAVPHYVTRKPISPRMNMDFLYLKIKDYVLRKFKIRQQHVFGSDTYDFKRELLVGEARSHVLDTICKRREITDTIFGAISVNKANDLMDATQNGDERAMKQLCCRFTAAILSEVFFEADNKL